MKKLLLLGLGLWQLTINISAQTVSQRLQKAFSEFENDSQLKHAISSLYVIDAKTGAVVFEKNAQVGLAPASTQKIITSVTAYELLGKEYRYETEFGYQGKIEKGYLDGRLFALGTGDPTLGSWRYESTREEEVIKRVIKSIKALRLDSVRYELFVEDSRFSTNTIPDRWIWQDIGNYYGAGSAALNWRENQYEIVLRSGEKIGDPVDIVDVKPYRYSNTELVSSLNSAAKGSGDNAYIFLPATGNIAYLQGTIPVNEKRFTISGAIADPAYEFTGLVRDKLKESGIVFQFDKNAMLNGAQDIPPVTKSNSTIFHTEISPPLDSIIYWFNKKSINLYGEALIKTFAYEKQGKGSTDSGVAILRKFWKDKGLDPEELNMYDGSGLSPMNRVTTHAQVEILKFAKSRPWFSGFYYALPEYNGMKVKSGTIGDVKGFCGYHKAKDGREYIFSFLVNNYSGKTSSLVNKMYKVMDEMK